MAVLRNSARVFRLVGHLGRGVCRLALDSILGSRRAFPRTTSDLTPTALSSIVGARVESVSRLDGASGTSSRARLALTGEGVPETVFVKMSAASAKIRMIGELASLGETEAKFYRHLAPECSGLPRSYGASFDPLTGRFVVVLEDMTRSPCEFPDTLRPLATEQVGLLVDCFAQLHARFWRRLPETKGSTDKLGWLIAPSDDPANPLTPSVMKHATSQLKDRVSLPLEVSRFVADNFQAITEVIDEGPHTVLHGDAHPGNTFFRAGCAGLLDWQMVRRGHPARDLAYMLVLGMPIAERQRNERDLLGRYRVALAAAGGPDIAPEPLWTRYRQSVVHPYISALCTAGLGGMQDDAIVLEGLRRAVAALEDLETGPVLRRSLS